ncbi:MAG: hypothetical protein HZB55_05435 [Deltaproteobacteria bacterium]|nr:hypothetical protein [Deltaproteobacteria bacterium]
MQLSEEVREFLEAASLAALFVPLDLGRGEEAVLVVKSTRDVLEGLKAASPPIELGWVLEPTERGPALCLAVRVRSPGIGELLAEVYFDVTDPADGNLLERLASQTRLQAALLDEEMDVVWVAEVPWDEVRALESDQMRDRAEELAERTEAYDFESARSLVHETVSLEQLAARAFAS